MESLGMNWRISEGSGTLKTFECSLCKHRLSLMCCDTPSIQRMPQADICWNRIS